MVRGKVLCPFYVFIVFVLIGKPEAKTGVKTAHNFMPPFHDYSKAADQTRK